MPTCEDCGKELKDDKYKKCYNCNKKTPSKKASGKYGDLSVPERNRRAKLTALSSACEAIKVLTGQVSDVDTIGAMVEQLYDRFYTKIAE